MLRIKLEDLLLFLVLIRLAPGFPFHPSRIVSFHLFLVCDLYKIELQKVTKPGFVVSLQVSHSGFLICFHCIYLRQYITLTTGNSNL